MLNSQQPPTQISSHAQLLEIFIEVDQRGDADADVFMFQAGCARPRKGQLFKEIPQHWVI